MSKEFDLLTSPLSGRFYEVSGLDLERVAAIAKTRFFRPNKDRYACGFCRSEPPYDSELSMESSDLGYSPDGGYVRMFLREEERQVSKKLLESEADRLAIAKGTRLFDLPGSAREELLDRAKAILFEKSIPKVRVRQVLLGQGTLFISNKSELDNLHGFFHSLVGDVRADDGFLDGHGSNTAMLVLLQAAIDDEFGKIAPDCTLLDVCGAHMSSKFHCKSGQLDLVRSLIDQKTSFALERIGVRIEGSQGATDLFFDRHGLYYVDPPSAPGGLFVERLRRRVEDVTIAKRRVRSLVSASYKKYTGKD